MDFQTSILLPSLHNTNSSDAAECKRLRFQLQVLIDLASLCHVVMQFYIYIYMGVYLYISLLSLYIVRLVKNRNYIVLNCVLKVTYLFLNCTVTLHSFQGKQLSPSFDIDPIMLLSSSPPNWPLKKKKKILHSVIF